MSKFDSKNIRHEDVSVISKTWKIYDPKEQMLLFAINMCGVIDEDPASRESKPIQFVNMSLIDNMLFYPLMNEQKDYINNFIIMGSLETIYRAEALLEDLEQYTPILMRLLEEDKDEQFQREFNRCHRMFQNWFINTLRTRELVIVPNQLDFVNNVLDLDEIVAKSKKPTKKSTKTPKPKKKS